MPNDLKMFHCLNVSMYYPSKPRAGSNLTTCSSLRGIMIYLFIVPRFSSNHNPAVPLTPNHPVASLTSGISCNVTITTQLVSPSQSLAFK